MSVPLDSDGFLRRQCPTCEREFKWKPADEDVEETQPQDGGYFCPYCVVQAPPGSWWTEAEIEDAKARAFDQVVKPQLDQLAGAADGSGFLEVEVSMPEPTTPSTPDEQDDMKRVDFPCHPEEPIKVLDDWDRAVHCLICGEAALASTGKTSEGE